MILHNFFYPKEMPRLCHPEPNAQSLRFHTLLIAAHYDRNVRWNVVDRCTGKICPSFLLTSGWFSLNTESFWCCCQNVFLLLAIEFCSMTSLVCIYYYAVFRLHKDVSFKPTSSAEFNLYLNTHTRTAAYNIQIR